MITYINNYLLSMAAIIMLFTIHEHLCGILWNYVMDCL